MGGVPNSGSRVTSSRPSSSSSTTMGFSAVPGSLSGAVPYDDGSSSLLVGDNIATVRGLSERAVGEVDSLDGGVTGGSLGALFEEEGLSGEGRRYGCADRSR